MPKKGNPPLQGELLQGTLDLLILKTLAPGPAPSEPADVHV